MKDLVIYGSGGFASGDLTWLIEDINREKKQWNLLGFLDDDRERTGIIRNTYEVLGTSEWLERRSDVHCVIGVGDSYSREKIRERIKESIKSFPALIHPDVKRSQHVSIGNGVVIMPGVLIAGGVTLNDFCILNLGCTIGHDVQVGSFAMVSPGAHISGYVCLGDYSNIGTGANIRQGQIIGEGTVIGAGAAVVSDIPAHSIAVGVPAKVIKVSQ